MPFTGSRLQRFKSSYLRLVEWIKRPVLADPTLTKARVLPFRQYRVKQQPVPEFLMWIRIPPPVERLPSSLGRQRGSNSRSLQTTQFAVGIRIRA